MYSVRVKQGNRRTRTAADCVAVTIIFYLFWREREHLFFRRVCNQHLVIRCLNTLPESRVLCSGPWPIQSSLSGIPKLSLITLNLTAKEADLTTNSHLRSGSTFVLHRDKQSGCSTDRRQGQVPLCLGPFSLFLLLMTN
jgi:hypothetical protein